MGNPQCLCIFSVGWVGCYSWDVNSSIKPIPKLSGVPRVYYTQGVHTSHAKDMESSWKAAGATPNTAQSIRPIFHWTHDPDLQTCWSDLNWVGTCSYLVTSCYFILIPQWMVHTQTLSFGRLWPIHRTHGPISICGLCNPVEARLTSNLIVGGASQIHHSLSACWSPRKNGWVFCLCFFFFQRA